MRVPDRVCGFPDCEWGCAVPDPTESQLTKCCSEFRQHCIERHGLDGQDMEAYVRLDLIEYTFTLLR
jgi:hypothetical protein